MSEKRKREENDDDIFSWFQDQDFCAEIGLENPEKLFKQDDENYKTKSISKVCSCKKSKCLKLYCECFSSGVKCDVKCDCIDCHNISGKTPEINRARKAISRRNPYAFKNKASGCKCKSSGCVKGYCDCFQNGVECSDSCECENCRNGKYSTVTYASTTQPIYDNLSLQCFRSSGEDEYIPILSKI